MGENYSRYISIMDSQLCVSQISSSTSERSRLLYSGGLCPGFGWDKVNFLQRSSYNAVFWICDEDNGDGTLVF